MYNVQSIAMTGHTYLSKEGEQSSSISHRSFAISSLENKQNIIEILVDQSICLIVLLPTVGKDTLKIYVIYVICLRGCSHITSAKNGGS